MLINVLQCDFALWCPAVTCAGAEPLFQRQAGERRRQASSLLLASSQVATRNGPARLPLRCANLTHKSCHRPFHSHSVSLWGFPQVKRQKSGLAPWDWAFPAFRGIGRKTPARDFGCGQRKETASLSNTVRCRPDAVHLKMAAAQTMRLK